MITSNVISLDIFGKSSGTVDHYISTPFKCTIKDVRARANTDFGNDDTLTLTGGGATLGVAAFGAAMAAGDAATWTEDTSAGNTVLSKGAAVKIQASAIATVAQDPSIHVDIEFDPYATTKDDFS